jgi:hypothetical protein
VGEGERCLRCVALHCAGRPHLVPCESSAAIVWTWPPGIWPHVVSPKFFGEICTFHPQLLNLTPCILISWYQTFNMLLQSSELLPFKH